MVRSRVIILKLDGLTISLDHPARAIAARLWYGVNQARHRPINGSPDFGTAGGQGPLAIPAWATCVDSNLHRSIGTRKVLILCGPCKTQDFFELALLFPG